jgi:hypothetical protein
LSDALLSSGEGRITIVACRAGQVSWIGHERLSIFSGALVRGLQGEAGNNHGYIGAFGLYEYLYQEVKDAAAELGKLQEAELTVIKGVGPFPVALCRGASQPGNFDSAEAVPTGAAVRAISPEKSRRSLQHYSAVLHGDGAIAQGDGAVAVGKGGIYIGGNAGDVNSRKKKRV